MSDKEIEKPIAVTIENTKTFYNRLNLPPRPVFYSSNPTKTQISLLDAKSPQEVLERHGMYRDDSLYSKHPEKIYGDLTQLGDYESNLNAIRSMQEKFNSLDIDVRARFNHDLSEFTKYCNSKDFDIARVLTDKELEKYNSYKKEVENKKNYEKYINSAEYKKSIQEEQSRRKYEEDKYNEWKKSQQLT